MTDDDIKGVQRLLAMLGQYRGLIDGKFGPLSRAALVAAMAAFRQGLTDPEKPAPLPPLPWIVEAMKTFGWHEIRDNARLRAYLRSDGKTLGDPEKLPWCGDWVETVIKLSLPAEPFVGQLATNPYFARHWTGFGVATEPTYGCIGVWARGNGGHVGFIIGHDPEAWHVLGGNQSDAVNITRISKSARSLLATRWPATFPARPIHLPARAAGNLQLSINEV